MNAVDHMRSLDDRSANRVKLFSPVIRPVSFDLDMSDKCNSRSGSIDTSGTHVVWHLAMDENISNPESILAELEVFLYRIGEINVRLVRYAIDS